MNTIGKEVPLRESVRRVVAHSKTGIWDGQSITPYWNSCQWFLECSSVGMLLTRDHYHHLSGWWKNPDYERCYHLSLSFYDANKQSKPKDPKLTEEILDLTFGKHKKKIWTEPPYSEIAKKMSIWHYRLFCNEKWYPIMPRKEVYTKEFTDPAWMSYSELQAYHKDQL